MKPDERSTDVERLLNGLQPPQPPPELRARVLAAAREAETAPNVWSRLWNHSGLRLAWATSVLVLLAGHVLVGTGNGPALETNLAADNRIDEYVVEFLRPARISEDAKPIVGLVAYGHGLDDLELEGNPS